MQKVVFQDLGLMDYQVAWDYQQLRHKELIDNKMNNRELQKEAKPMQPQRHYLLFCEHPPVYTLGKSGSMDNLLLSASELESQGFQFYKINRGGDITYHGPGQIVGYPIFDLDEFFTDIHRYVRYLEEVVILTLAAYGLQGIREEGYTGVWLEASEQLPKRKICAIGVHLSRWVTLHGFAFNINTQLDHFHNIVPCGINEPDKDVTSLAKELGHQVPITEVKLLLKRFFAEKFDFEYSDL
ncbi:MAG TPA: lipoyl(octanoyl) transferase LipB [Saprospiraceae bacterium]|nr:lipoyl(octanoyl) transferase LipB [Saprospiraceae bacterium]HMQ85896.1 lipoyl(octanoyl) transferase LipB [Saprospiraceae bacterium]